MDRMDRMKKMTNAAAALLAIGPDMNRERPPGTPPSARAIPPFHFRPLARATAATPESSWSSCYPVHPVSRRSRTGGNAYSAR